MQPDVKGYLIHIKTAIDSINEYLGEKRDFKAYEANKQLRRAVERELEIVGEATSKLLKLKPDIEIPNARRIVNLRNLVIHAYDSVDNVIIWTIVEKDIPLLKQQVSILLQELG